MLFNADKCKVMHFGHNNLMMDYTLDWMVKFWTSSGRRRIWGLFYRMIWKHLVSASRHTLKRTG